MTLRSVPFGHAVSGLAKTTVTALLVGATFLSLARAAQTHGECADPVAAGVASSGGEIVWIDAGIETPDALIEALPAGTEVRVLVPGVDALGQIAASLAGRTEVRAVHLISHGAPGRLLLAGQWLDSAGVAARAADLERVQRSLAPGADILLYGCDTGRGAEGRTFLRALAQATGADVAASSGLTGAGDLGGDWNLETREGGIEARTLWSGTAGPDYRHVLATVLLDNTWLANGADDWTSSDNQAGGDLVGTVNNMYFGVGITAFDTPPVQFTVSSVSATPFKLDSITVQPFSTPETFELEILPNGSEVGKVTRVITNQPNELITIPTHLNSITSFTVRFVDVRAGGHGEAPNALSFLSMEISPVDFTAPTLAIGLSDTALRVGETSLVTFTFSEPVAGFANGDITVPNGTLTAVDSSDGGTTWTATYTPTADVTDASNLISVDMTGVQDLVANPGVGTTDSGNFTIDTLAPAAPSTPDLIAASDSGASSTDNVTSTTTPTFVGTAEANSTVEVLVGGSTSLGTTTADGSGNWSLAVGSAFADGTHSITARSSDAAGNTGVASAALAVTIDTTAPAIGTQPVGGTFVAGDAFNLSVAATDAAALAYQWRLDGTPLSDSAKRTGSTTATLAHTDIETTGFHGSYTVVVTDLAGNSATSSAAVVTVNKADQTVTFTPVGPITVGTPVTLSATASSGLAVTYSVVSGDASLTGDQLTVNSAASTVTVRATQSGNGNYNAASSDQSITSTDITKLSQTITFTQPGDKLTTDSAFALSATASSGLAVTFTVQSGPASVSGSTVTLTGVPGTVTVVASQAGDGAYDAAASVTRSFDVTAPAPLVGFGPVSEGAQERGQSAVWLAADGSGAVLIGFIPGQGGFVLEFTPDAHTGAFSATTEALTTTPGQPATTWTFAGQVQGGGVSGTITELGYTFAATFDPATGPTAAIAGYYVAAALDTTTGKVHSIVGTTGTIYVLAVLPDLVDGIKTTVDGTSGDYTGLAASGLVTEGVVAASTESIDGAIVRTGGGLVTDYAGLRINTTRTDRLINLSSRARVGSGEEVLITGFHIGGAQPREVLLRAVGPGLDRLGVTGTLSDPRLALMQGNSVLDQNDDWGQAPNSAAIAAAFGTTGAFGLSPTSRDAAMLITLPPGTYTVVVSGADGPGIALAEIYDATTSVDVERLVNISARGFVGTGDDILIGGFIVSGNAPKRILVRGVGPSLARYGVATTLADPVLVVRQGATMLAQNDDWGTGANTAAELAAAATATSAFALNADSKDAAILLTLAPGSYTAQVSGAAGANGIALVEVYEVP